MKLPILLLSLLSSALSTPSLSSADLSLRAFEQSYLNTLSYALPNTTIKLVGFKKITMSPSELADLEHAIATRPAEWAAITSAYYDPVERAMRVYFPVQRALVRHGGKLIEASDMGELEHEVVDGDCAVVGRYQTEEVKGVSNNRVEGGMIWLREESKVVRRYGGGNVHVYDFGCKFFASVKEGEKGGC
jgi:hypothetical protein